jgi:hypothetical protein
MSLILDGSVGVSDVDGSAATPAIRGTDANTGMFFPAADTIAFSEGGVESMRLDSSGNLGIGASSIGANNRLEIGGVQKYFAFTGNTGSGGSVNPSSSFGLSIGWNRSNGEGESNIIYGTGAGASPALQFASWNGTTYAERMRIDSSGRVGIATASPEASLQVNGTNGQLILSAGNVPSSGASTNKWRLGLRELTEGDFNILHFNGTSYDNIVNIQPAGQARFINTIGVGNTGGSTSGAGITFPATQSASSNANTLDDYEEGTWTPTDASGAGLSLTAGNARYTKVGNIVVACAEIVYPSTGNGNAATIGGFPFTCSGSSTWGGFQRYVNNSLTYTLAMVPNGTTVQLYKLDGNAVANSQLTGARVDFVVVYTV